MSPNHKLTMRSNPVYIYLPNFTLPKISSIYPNTTLKIAYNVINGQTNQFQQCSLQSITPPLGNQPNFTQPYSLSPNTPFVATLSLPVTLNWFHLQPKPPDQKLTTSKSHISNANTVWKRLASGKLLVEGQRSLNKPKSFRTLQNLTKGNLRCSGFLYSGSNVAEITF
ncbi:hypothetical protein TWF569_011832 [Orbilia oligospora]|uniref:Uncharacterized protein n=1 Tax=Orbilia oligospora TaxID=2813651 RepID=A0A7C8JG07_ORBOL|nr:hypothetical protein TWF102_005468 [Orbilia oligospora]KAF3125772.1 hypothetical protein TWF594_001334 [Orbilia oligospora]KAF3127215.1 hypothetical protein TWF569_011832 [Orbilia oligospora]KAF3129826.1 hypothetical protein TWF703_008564 [Orbilia oligospora]